MLYYKILITDNCFDYPAGCVLRRAYLLSAYMYCEFERVTAIGENWEKITADVFNANYAKPEIPGGGGSIVSIGQVVLPASAWVGSGCRFSQVVDIDGVTEKSQVDLTPSAEQLEIFYDKSLALVAENEGGVVTVIAVGQKPENDYTIQVTITEVNA